MADLLHRPRRYSPRFAALAILVVGLVFASGFYWQGCENSYTPPAPAPAPKPEPEPVPVPTPPPGNQPPPTRDTYGFGDLVDDIADAADAVGDAFTDAARYVASQKGEQEMGQIRANQAAARVMICDDVGSYVTTTVASTYGIVAGAAVGGSILAARKAGACGK